MADDLAALLAAMEADDDRQRAEGLDQSERWRSITRETGRFLYQLAMVRRPERIVEVGTSHGYSTVWLGLAAERLGATVTTYEVARWRYEPALENLTAAGLDDVVTAELVDPGFDDYPDAIDLVFLDAEKADYVRHFDRLVPRLAPNGVVVADNVESHRDELAGYLEHVRGHPECYSTLVPLGRGLEVTRRLVPGEVDVVEALR